jgi:hypothetical protein
MAELAGGITPLTSLRPIPPRASESKPADQTAVTAVNEASAEPDTADRFSFSAAARRETGRTEFVAESRDDTKPPAPIREPLPSLTPDRLEPNEIFERQSERISGQIKQFRQVRDRIRDLLADARTSLVEASPFPVDPNEDTESSPLALALAETVSTTGERRAPSGLDVEY